MTVPSGPSPPVRDFRPFAVQPSLAGPQFLQIVGLALAVALLLALWFRATITKVTGALGDFLASTLPFPASEDDSALGGIGNIPVLVLVNAKSGGGLGSTIASVLEQIPGIEVYHLSTLGLNECVRRLRQLRKRNPRLVCAGGDGTVTAVVRTLLSAGLSSIPVAVLPLGTGNDCARSLGMKALPSAASVRAMKRWVDKVTRAPVISTDIFDVSFETFDGGGIVCVRNGVETQLSETVVKGTALCYCSVGTDARITYTVELNRRRSRALNMLTYFAAGAVNNFALRTPVTDNIASVILNPRSTGFEAVGQQGATSLEIDPRYIPRLHSLLCLLIPSYAAGTNAWRFAWSLSSAVYRSYHPPYPRSFPRSPGSSNGQESQPQAPWFDNGKAPIPHQFSLLANSHARASSSSSSSSGSTSGSDGVALETEACCATARARLGGLVTEVVRRYKRQRAPQQAQGSTIYNAEPAYCCSCLSVIRSLVRRPAAAAGAGVPGAGIGNGCPVPPPSTNPYRDLEAGGLSSAPSSSSAAGHDGGDLLSKGRTSPELALFAGYSSPSRPSASSKLATFDAARDGNGNGEGGFLDAVGRQYSAPLPRSRPWYLRLWGCLRRQGRRLCSSPDCVPWWHPQRRDDGLLEFIGIRSILQMGAVIGMQTPLWGGLYRLAQPSSVLITFKRPPLVSDVALSSPPPPLQASPPSTAVPTPPAPVSQAPTVAAADAAPASSSQAAPPAVSTPSSLLRRAAAAVGRGAVKTVGVTARVVRTAASGGKQATAAAVAVGGGIVSRRRNKPRSAVQAPPEMVEIVPTVPGSHHHHHSRQASDASSADGQYVDHSNGSSDEEGGDGNDASGPGASLALAQPSPTRARSKPAAMMGESSYGQTEHEGEGPASLVEERGFAVVPRGQIVIDHDDYSYYRARSASSSSSASASSSSAAAATTVSLVPPAAEPANPLPSSSPTGAIVAGQVGIRQRAVPITATPEEPPPSGRPPLPTPLLTSASTVTPSFASAGASPISDGPRDAASAAASAPASSYTALPTPAASSLGGTASAAIAIQGRAFSETEPIFIQIDGESYKIFGLKSLSVAFKAKARVVTFAV